MLDYVTAGWSPDRNNVTAGGIPEQSKVREVKQCCHGIRGNGAERMVRARRPRIETDFEHDGHSESGCGRVLASTCGWSSRRR